MVQDNMGWGRGLVSSGKLAETVGRPLLILLDVSSVLRPSKPL